MWLKLDHANVLALKGLVWSETSSLPSLITDWMEKGSLREYLCHASADNLQLVSRC